MFCLCFHCPRFSRPAFSASFWASFCCSPARSRGISELSRNTFTPLALGESRKLSGTAFTYFRRSLISPTKRRHGAFCSPLPIHCFLPFCPRDCRICNSLSSFPSRWLHSNLSTDNFLASLFAPPPFCSVAARSTIVFLFPLREKVTSVRCEALICDADTTPPYLGGLSLLLTKGETATILLLRGHISRPVTYGCRVPCGGDDIDRVGRCSVSKTHVCWRLSISTLKDARELSRCVKNSSLRTTPGREHLLLCV